MENESISADVSSDNYNSPSFKFTPHMCSARYTCKCILILVSMQHVLCTTPVLSLNTWRIGPLLLILDV